MKSSTLTSSIPQREITSEPRRILCPTDFSEFSDLAYRYALSIACHYRARLFVQHVVELWRHPEANFAPPRYYAEFRGHLLPRGEQEPQKFFKTHPYTEFHP